MKIPKQSGCCQDNNGQKSAIAEDNSDAAHWTYRSPWRLSSTSTLCLASLVQERLWTPTKENHKQKIRKIRKATVSGMNTGVLGLFWGRPKPWGNLLDFEICWGCISEVALWPSQDFTFLVNLEFLYHWALQTVHNKDWEECGSCVPAGST